MKPFRVFALVRIAAIVCSIACGPALAQESSFVAPSIDIGAFGALWLPGEVETDRYVYDKEIGPLVQGFADFYLMPNLATGLFAGWAYGDLDEGEASFVEFGVAIKSRFVLSGSIAIKPGLQIGYRIGDGHLDYEGSGDFEAMGVNLSVEAQWDAGVGIVPFGVVGLLSQPAGGNDDSDVTFGPILYVGVGAVL